jgi:hypothetical protein
LPVQRLYVRWLEPFAGAENRYYPHDSLHNAICAFAIAFSPQPIATEGAPREDPGCSRSLRIRGR